MKFLLLCGFAMILSSTSAWAQSLKPEAPAPLQPGINKGTIDNMIGTHYWSFTGGPGKTRVHAKFKSMGLMGNPSRATITITLYDAANTWHTPKIMTSDTLEAECTFDGDLKSPTKLVLKVVPPPNGFVRMGGDYEIEATGAVSFGQKSNTDPVIGTYKQMSGYTALLGDCKFLPDGTVQTTSGANGSWKLFDESSHTYVINIDRQDTHNLQFVSGRGLCDGDSVVFQQLR